MTTFSKYLFDLNLLNSFWVLGLFLLSPVVSVWWLVLDLWTLEPCLTIWSWSTGDQTWFKAYVPALWASSLMLLKAFWQDFSLKFSLYIFSSLLQTYTISLHIHLDSVDKMGLSLSSTNVILSFIFCILFFCLYQKIDHEYLCAFCWRHIFVLVIANIKEKVKII